MGAGSQATFGGRGSVDFTIGEPFNGNPSTSPGLPRPVGWLVRVPDGSAAYYKFGTGDTQWTTLGTSTGVTSVSAGPGISVTGPAATPTINNTGVITATAGTGLTNSGTATNPIFNATATSFPGFGAAPPAAAASSAAGSSGLAAQSDHTHAAALEHGSYTPPAALQAGGILQQTYSPTTGTLALATFPAGRVPAGAAGGDGTLRTDDILWYDEAAGAGGTTRAHYYVGISATLNNNASTGSALHLYSADGSVQAVLRIQSVYTAGNSQDAEIQFVAGPRGGVGATAEWLVGRIHDSSYGGRFGSLDFYTGYNTADFQSSLCGSFQAGGLRMLGPLWCDTVFAVDAGSPDVRNITFLHMRTGSSAPAVAPSGTGRIYYDNTADVNRWKVSQGGGGQGRLYANIARFGNGTATASTSQLILPTNGQFLHITGTNTINYIAYLDIFADGDAFWLYFDSALTLTHNAGSVPANYYAMKLVGGVDAAMAAGSKILFIRDTSQTKFVELQRCGA